MMNKTTKEDIEFLSNHLSEMNSSLKPLVFRPIQSPITTKTAVQVCKSPQRYHISTSTESNLSPDINNELIVSLSPLVAWHVGDCRVTREKQLFLLTPLSKKERLLRCADLTKFNARNSNMRDSSDALQPSPLAAVISSPVAVSKAMEEFYGSKACIVEINSRVKTKLKMPIFKALPCESSLQGCGLRSEAFQKKCTALDHLDDEEVSVAVLTKNKQLKVPPHLHNFTSRRKDAANDKSLDWFLSPPKSCILMNPEYGGSKPLTAEDKKGSLGGETFEWFLSPPKTCTLMNPDYDNSKASIAVVRSLISRKKMPRCYKESKKPIEKGGQTFEWFLSPPKTCIVMNPDYSSKPSSMRGESLSAKMYNFKSKRNLNERLEWFLSPPKTRALLGEEPLDGKIAPTPAALSSDSMHRSWLPGESILKRELWAKFQALPNETELCYRDSSAFKKQWKKGFMDMLEEEAA